MAFYSPMRGNISLKSSLFNSRNVLPDTGFLRWPLGCLLSLHYTNDLPEIASTRKLLVPGLPLSSTSR